MGGLDNPSDKGPDKKRNKGITRRGFLTMAGLGALAELAAVGGPLVGKVASPRKSPETETPLPTGDTMKRNEHMAGMKFHEVYPGRSVEEEKRHKENMRDQSAGFSEAWRHPEKITTPMGEEVDLYDMYPKEEKTSVPVVMVSGWTGNAELWKKNMREFVSRGRRAMVVDATHGVAYSPDLQRHIDETTDKATYVEYRKIAATMVALDAKKIEKADAIAHSEGCIDLLIAAVTYPDRFRNIVLVEPAGMIGSDSFWALCYRNQVKDVPAMKKAHEAQKRGDPGYTFDVHPDDPMFPDTIGKALNSPGAAFLAYQELLSIARIQVVDLLREIKSKSIGVVIVHSPEDGMFPMSRMTGTVRRDERGNIMIGENRKPVMETKGAIGEQKHPDEPDYSNIVDGFISVKGVHTRFFDQPAEYTQLVEGALTALEAKQAKR